ncbi:hypothetical protein Drorol1_Dr00015852 [Drosera rotundifolia]
MIISGEMDHVQIPSTDGLDSVHCTNDLDRSFPSICVDVGVVPEQKQCELKRMISNLEDEITELRLKQRSLHDKIKGVLNQILDIKGSIRVFCRRRPYMPNERKSKHEPILAGSEKVVIRLVGSRKEFDFDKVFLPNSTQEDVFFEVKPILRSAIDGHNACILAYGFADEMGKARKLGTLKQYIVGRSSEATFSEAFGKQEAILRYLGGIDPTGENLRISQKQEAAKQCNCTIADIENTLAKFMWAKEAQSKMQKLQEEGKPLPKSMAEVQKLMGSTPLDLARSNLAKSGQPKGIKIPFAEIFFIFMNHFLFRY